MLGASVPAPFVEMHRPPDTDIFVRFRPADIAEVVCPQDDCQRVFGREPKSQQQSCLLFMLHDCELRLMVEFPHQYQLEWLPYCRQRSCSQGSHVSCRKLPTRPPPFNDAKYSQSESVRSNGRLSAWQQSQPKPTLLCTVVVRRIKANVVPRGPPAGGKQRSETLRGRCTELHTHSSHQ